MSKKDKSLGDFVAVGTALAGAAFGAAAVLLSDKKNQAKVKKTVDGVSHEAVEIGKNIKKKVDEFGKSTQTTEKKTVLKVKKVVKKRAAAKKPASSTKK